MLQEICAELKNYFVNPEKDIHLGTYSIVDGDIASLSSLLLDGQYFRIVGSRLNDGVYQYKDGHCNIVPAPYDVCMNETFEGAIWVMAVPPAVISLSREIKSWVDKYSEAINSPYASESFGGYSYTKQSGSGVNGSVSWKDTFSAKLKPYRRARVL